MGTHDQNRHENGASELVYGYKLSSVGPARVTGDLTYHPTNMDLAMKLHYLRSVYFFNGSSLVDGLTVPFFKETLFFFLNYFYESCARLRRSDDSGRPYLKCNDCGIRFVEAQCCMSIEEWLAMEDSSALTHRLLVPNRVLGPDLTFSPLCFLQLTFFKCGGMSVGLSWSHILGDAFSLTYFMGRWAQVISGHNPTYQPNLNKPHAKVDNFTAQKVHSSGPLTMKQVGPVGDHWVPPPSFSSEMATFSFHLSGPQLAQLQSRVMGPSESGPFESLCAVIWLSIAKVKDGPEPNLVTVIKHDTDSNAKHKIKEDDDDTIRNDQVVGVVEAEFPIVKARPAELALLVRDGMVDERAQITKAVERDSVTTDHIIYGANLTFVDWGEANWYGFEFKGQGPCLATCFIDGVGEEGAVLVLSTPNEDVKGGNQGRFVTLILPHSYMEELKRELQIEWSLLS